MRQAFINFMRYPIALFCIYVGLYGPFCMSCKRHGPPDRLVFEPLVHASLSGHPAVRQGLLDYLSAWGVDEFDVAEIEATWRWNLGDQPDCGAVEFEPWPTVTQGMAPW